MLGRHDSAQHRRGCDQRRAPSRACPLPGSDTAAGRATAQL